MQEVERLDYWFAVLLFAFVSLESVAAGKKRAQVSAQSQEMEH